MPAAIMTYDELANAWGVSREAARKKVEGLRLQKQTGNDGKVRVIVDLDEVQHRPLKKRRPRGDRGGDRAETARVITALEAHVTTLQDMLTKAEAVATRERERADGATGKADQARADAERERTERLTERERADKLAGEVTALARKIADLMAQANARRPVSLPPPAELVRRRSWLPWRRAG